ncbi:hypothetical protein Ddye_005598 [Dipteronia dyeriana]|uniref:Uncharacterized protein n=1 Tax=Dipteronia dyeriana TaxID=168575 RepID=A0AAE0CPS6_9ROSI|nr:hypothetical protein Ddye_005598 [Dipteronia dyeriana]
MGDEDLALCLFGKIIANKVVNKEVLEAQLRQFGRLRVVWKYRGILPKKGGSLMMFWREEIDLNVISFSKGHTNAVIKDDGGVVWRFTRFYGDPCYTLRTYSWELLRRLMRWIICLRVVKGSDRLNKYGGGTHRFHFEHSWANEEECGVIVKHTWELELGVNAIERLQSSIKKC